jgi:hypothetical protein
MKTKKEIYVELLREYLSDSFPEDLLDGRIELYMTLTEQDVLYQAMEEYGRQTYNQAVEFSADAAKRYVDFNKSESSGDAVKERILNLLI